MRAGSNRNIVILLMLPEPDDRDDSAKGNALACIARALRDLETVAEAPRSSWPRGLLVLVDTTLMGMSASDAVDGSSTGT